MPTLELLEGDCLTRMKSLPAKSIDCFLCDLPYGCLSGGAGQEKARRADTGGVLACDWDFPIDLDAFWKEVKRLARNDKVPVIMFCTTRFGYELIKSNPSWFRYDLVWDKLRGTSFLLANKMPLRSHEMIYIFSKTGAHFQRVVVSGDFKKWSRNREKDINRCYGVKYTSSEGGDGKRCARSVIYCDGHLSRKKDMHPTEKPVQLYKWLLERYCVKGGTVLDPTAGSFNSCFTAFDMGYSAVGIENHPEYFKRAIKRVEQMEQQNACESL